MLVFISAFAAQAVSSASGVPANCVLFQAGYRVPLLCFLFKPPPPHTTESTAVRGTCDHLRNDSGYLLGLVQ